MSGEPTPDRRAEIEEYHRQVLQDSRQLPPESTSTQVLMQARGRPNGGISTLSRRQLIEQQLNEMTLNPMGSGAQGAQRQSRRRQLRNQLQTEHEAPRQAPRHAPRQAPERPPTPDPEVEVHEMAPVMIELAVPTLHGTATNTEEHSDGGPIRGSTSEPDVTTLDPAQEEHRYGS